MSDEPPRDPPNEVKLPQAMDSEAQYGISPNVSLDSPSAFGQPDRVQSEAINFAGRRERLGRTVGGVGLLTVAGSLIAGHCSISATMMAPGQGETFVLVKMLAHAVVAVSGVFLGYQLLKAADRLIIPWWFIEKNERGASLLLGVSDPATQASASASDVLNATRGLLRGKAPESGEKK